MNTLSLSKYGPIVSEKESGESIYNEITDALKTNKNVTIDFKGIKSMATYCAKQIFGKLYIELTAEIFFERITLINVNDDIRIIIKMGITSAIQASEE